MSLNQQQIHLRTKILWDNLLDHSFLNRACLISMRPESLQDIEAWPHGNHQQRRVFIHQLVRTFATGEPKSEQSTKFHWSFSVLLSQNKELHQLGSPMPYRGTQLLGEPSFTQVKENLLQSTISSFVRLPQYVQI